VVDDALQVEPFIAGLGPPVLNERRQLVADAAAFRFGSQHLSLLCAPGRVWFPATAVEILLKDMADEGGSGLVALGGLGQGVPVERFGKVKLNALNAFFQWHHR
jgi:hypothetical protein